MKKINYLNEAKEEFLYAKTIRRTIHKNPEIGFDVINTKEYIKKKIIEIGFDPIEIGDNGILVNIKGKNNYTLLLRSDMDALSIKEQTSLSFKSQNNYMHACGHDLHCAILLGTLKIIKKYEKRINKNLKILFQPAEEILQGAKNMIENGVLNNPSVDAAIMVHVLPNASKMVGDIILPPSGIIAPSSDFFEIEIRGKSTHGAMPHLGVDATLIGSHILLSLEELISREVSFNDKAILTIGSFNSGISNNVISEKAILKGTLRTLDEEVRNKLKDRMKNIIKYVSKAFNAEGKIKFTSGCPSFYSDEILKGKIYEVLNKEFKGIVIDSKDLSSKIGVGSEDFAYFSRIVPSYMISLNSGQSASLHNPKVVFDEKVLIDGTATLLSLVFEL